MPPVPANITDLSQTAGSNSPAGSESPALLDDYTRTVFAFIAKLRDGQGLSNPVDLASAATTDIGAQTSLIVRITGTTTITSFGANYAGPRFLTFAAALTLTHNATSLILPGGANITTAAGDCCIAVPNLSTPSGWRVVLYQRALTAPITLPLPTTQGGSGSNYADVAALFAGIKQAATDSASGVVELATDAEAQVGTDTSRAITAANLKAAQIQLGTAVALTTQTSVDFTGIPSWAKRVTVMLDGVSTNGTSLSQIQLGDSGGIETTGYTGATGSSGHSSGFLLWQSSLAAASVMQATIILNRVTPSGNQWIASINTALSSANTALSGCGTKSLSAQMDRIRLTTVIGTEQFDSGSINIFYE